MTITKSSVNYTINDILENGWTISGNMNVTDNETSINISVYDNSESEDKNSVPPMNKEIGNYYYRKSDRVNVSYSVVKESDEALLLEACKKIVVEALSKD